MSIDNNTYTIKPLIIYGYTLPLFNSIEPNGVIRNHTSKIILKGDYFAKTNKIEIMLYRLSDNKSIVVEGNYINKNEVLLNLYHRFLHIYQDLIMLFMLLDYQLIMKIGQLKEILF